MGRELTPEPPAPEPAPPVVLLLAPGTRLAGQLALLLEEQLRRNGGKASPTPT